MLLSHFCQLHPVSSISSNRIRLLPIHTQFQSIPQTPKCIEETNETTSGSNYLFAACMSPPSAMADLVLQYDNLESQLLANRPIPRMLQTLLDSHLTGLRSCESSSGWGLQKYAFRACIGQFCCYSQWTVICYRSNISPFLLPNLPTKGVEGASVSNALYFASTLNYNLTSWMLLA
jgi:hypothetical protein